MRTDRLSPARKEGYREGFRRGLWVGFKAAMLGLKITKPKEEKDD